MANAKDSTDFEAGGEMRYGGLVEWETILKGVVFFVLGYVVGRITS